MKTPITPDVVDEVDADDVVEGLGVDGLATASSSTSGWINILTSRMN